VPLFHLGPFLIFFHKRDYFRFGCRTHPPEVPLPLPLILLYPSKARLSKLIDSSPPSVTLGPRKHLRRSSPSSSGLSVFFFMVARGATQGLAGNLQLTRLQRLSSVLCHHTLLLNSLFLSEPHNTFIFPIVSPAFPRTPFSTLPDHSLFTPHGMYPGTPIFLFRFPLFS